MVHHICSLGVGAMVRDKHGGVIVGGGDGTLNSFDWQSVRSQTSRAVIEGSITSLSIIHGGGLIAGTAEGEILKWVAHDGQSKPSEAAGE